MLFLTEIQKAATQGRTKPFLCVGEDGKSYYAKGKAATPSGLMKEWIAAYLAQAFGLPIPPFHIAYVDRLLVEAHSSEAIKYLGNGEVFISEQIPAIIDFKHQFLKSVPSQLQRDILFFDLWIENADRTLSKQFSGNPNLLWQPEHQQLYVIDHNLAFDVAFNLQDFKETHVCQAHFATEQLDIQEQQALEQKLQNSLLSWSQAWATIPEEWKAQNKDSKIFDADVTFQRLQLEAQGGIWSKWL